MQLVDKSQLSGYRRPTEAEHRIMQRYTVRYLERTNRMNGFWSIFLGIVDISMILTFAGMAGEYSSTQRLAFAGMAVILTIALFGLWKHGNNNRKLISRITQGKFEVLDCRVSGVDFSVKMTNGALAKICTENGQYCKDNFKIDRISINAWNENKKLMFRLMKCKYDEVESKDFYELFSEKTLEKG